MLSPGQIHALKTKTKVDGSEASSSYMKSVERTVKLKIFDACTGLQQIYREFPEYKELIDSALSWHGTSQPTVSTPTDAKKKPSANTSHWPDDPKAEGVPVVVDRDAAFKGFPGL